jgi:Fur family ferric uptake transcriptional regulator
MVGLGRSRGRDGGGHAVPQCSPIGWRARARGRQSRCLSCEYVPSPSQPGPSWPEYAFERLSLAGYRRGGARRAVVELLARQDCARSVIELERDLDADNRRAARASVYRVLEELESVGLVARVEVGDGVARFEAVYPDGLNHHHHMVCSDCGELLPFHDENLERAIRQLSRRVDFEVSDHDVILRGHCGDCQPA